VKDPRAVDVDSTGSVKRGRWNEKDDPMLRRTALGFLAALAATGLAATLEPAAAAPDGATAVPAVADSGAGPAFTPIGTTPSTTPGKAPATVKDHGLLVCPPPANYDPTSTAP
jgi:hypothetical protein